MVSELRFETKKIRMADLGKESCVPDLLGELTMQNQLEFHLDETDEIYEGYGRVKVLIHIGRGTLIQESLRRWKYIQQFLRTDI